MSFQWGKLCDLLLNLERETGIEPATNGLGSRYSTIELLPLRSLIIPRETKANRPMLSPATQRRRETLPRSLWAKLWGSQVPSPALQAPAATPQRSGRSAESHQWRVRRTPVQPPLVLPLHPTCRASRLAVCREHRGHGRRVRPGAGVQLLGNLFAQIEAPNG
jgi:hypothetical protein